MLSFNWMWIKSSWQLTLAQWLGFIIELKLFRLLRYLQSCLNYITARTWTMDIMLFLPLVVELQRFPVTPPNHLFCTCHILLPSSSNHLFPNKLKPCCRLFGEAFMSGFDSHSRSHGHIIAFLRLHHAARTFGCERRDEESL